MFVPKSPRQIFMIVLAAATLLTSCTMGAAPAPTVDVNAINTAAVSTAMAQLSLQFTQTALAAPTFTATPTNTAPSLPTLATVTAGTPAGIGTLPTLSFNTTPVTGTTPLPGFTPLASPAPPSGATAALGDACNNSAFEGDVTIPDGEVLKPGVNFQKIWKLRNTGTCAWDEGYTLVYIGGSTPNLDPYNYVFGKNGTDDDFVAGGEAINMAINLTTPCTPGKYEGHWRMKNDKGYYFGTLLSVYVEVKEKC